ncbi:MAG: heme-binding protein [Rhizobiales bacterium]|nr:heme-binding protein [Hyphomicrobiales bacterium]
MAHSDHRDGGSGAAWGSIGEARMPMRVVMALMIGAALCVAGAAQGEPATPAQPPAGPAATPSPPAPEYGLPISTEQAKAAAAAALAEASKNNWRMAVAIVGPEGSVIYFEKIDGAQNASFLLATAKARTSALFRRSSKLFVDQFAAGNVAFMTFPDEARPTASEGGLPIIVDGKIIGAIGVSGGTGQQNGVAATAGVNAVQ